MVHHSGSGLHFPDCHLRLKIIPFVGLVFLKGHSVPQLHKLHLEGARLFHSLRRPALALKCLLGWWGGHPGPRTAAKAHKQGVTSS